MEEFEECKYEKVNRIFQEKLINKLIDEILIETEIDT